MINIEAKNAEGVHELLLIGTALKDAKARLLDIEEQPTDELENAILIIDNVVDKGFSLV